MLVVGWLIFGSSGIEEKTDVGQIREFVMRMPDEVSEHLLVKSIVQPAKVRSVSCDPHSFVYKRLYCSVDSAGKRVVGPKLKKFSISDVQLNHYYTRSLEAFKKKIERGRADTDFEGSKRPLSGRADSFEDTNARCTVKDTAIVELVDKLQKRNRHQ